MYNYQCNFRHPIIRLFFIHVFIRNTPKFGDEVFWNTKRSRVMSWRFSAKTLPARLLRIIRIPTTWAYKICNVNESWMSDHNLSGSDPTLNYNHTVCYEDLRHRNFSWQQDYTGHYIPWTNQSHIRSRERIDISSKRPTFHWTIRLCGSLFIKKQKSFAFNLFDSNLASLPTDNHLQITNYYTNGLTNINYTAVGIIQNLMKPVF